MNNASRPHAAVVHVLGPGELFMHAINMASTDASNETRDANSLQDYTCIDCFVDWCCCCFAVPKGANAA
jgi:hypothetical protein